MRKRTKLEVYAYTVHGSIAQFSEDMGFSNVSVWKWIHGHCRPSLRNATKIADKTEGFLSVEYLRDNLK